MYFLKNPREAPPGNRTLWLVTWMLELSILAGVVALAVGTWLMLAGKEAADVVLMLGAVGALMGIFGGYGMTIYQKKSTHRAEMGKDPKFEGEKPEGQ